MPARAVGSAPFGIVALRHKKSPPRGEASWRPFPASPRVRESLQSKGKR
jgi:hypothetical protein